MKETILVVEDGDAVRNLVCLMLVENGYRVLEARDGRDALRLCENHREPIQLVLSDLVMPHMPGGELAARLRQVRPAVRVLLMSGCPELAMAQRLGGEPLAFLPKPFTSIDLVDKVREVLDTPRRHPAGGKHPDG